MSKGQNLKYMVTLFVLLSVISTHRINLELSLMPSVEHPDD